jgi:hypothetical protein
MKLFTALSDNLLRCPLDEERNKLFVAVRMPWFCRVSLYGEPPPNTQNVVATGALEKKER